MLVIPLALVFFDRPSHGEIIVLSLLIFPLLLLGCSGYFAKRGLSVAEIIGRIIVLVFLCSFLTAIYAWHFWPEQRPQIITRHDIQLFPQEQLHTSDTLNAQVPSASKIVYPLKAASAINFGNRAIFLDCEQSNLPIEVPPFSEIFFIDPGMPRGLVKFGTGATGAKYPRPDFSGLGFRCEFLNYEDTPIFNVSTQFALRYAVAKMDALKDAEGHQTGFQARGTDTIDRVEQLQVYIPRIEAKGKFEFLVWNMSDSRHFVQVQPPAIAKIETKSNEEPVTVAVRIVNKNQMNAMWLSPNTQTQ